jgi:hypothetical protein
MALIGAHTPGATPLTEEDIRGLKLASITTQGELNEHARSHRHGPAFWIGTAALERKCIA